MSEIRPGYTTQAQFFDPKNEAMLERLLNTDFQRRVGGDVTDKQKARLQKTVRHYMNEVYSKNPTQPVQYLNKEVLTAVVPDFMSYLRRNSGPTVAEDQGEGAALRTDVNSRFDRLQSERQEGRAAAPPAPDFRVSLDEDGPSPLSRFEEIKRMREVEAARDAAAMAALAGATAPTSMAIVPVATQKDSLAEMIASDADFRSSAAQAKARDQLALLMREEQRAAARAAGAAATAPNPVLPDPRRLLLGDGTGLMAAGAGAPSPIPPLPRTQGIAPSNPVAALSDQYRDRPVLPQDLIRPQDDIVSYTENEYNLFVYSADRDWVSNNSENRYNFSVNFDPANNRPGFGYSPATNIKFKNIVRIEFVKAIMPVETCEILPSYTGAGSLTTALSVNTLSFPYLQVRIPELNTNGYGTNDGVNNAFAVISYDAYWTGDTTAANRGFTRLIPKFLKCQKVFSPTPLATLQKLSFEIQRPDGVLFCESKDTLDIGSVYMPAGGTAGTNYDGAATWIWLNTSSYFSRFMVSQGDRIQIKNISVNATLAADPNAQALIRFLTRDEGHLVSDIGILTAGPTYADGVNSVGYANSIIIKSEFNDPTTGATGAKSWATSIQTTLNANPTLTTGRLINLNHQIQICMRVITREFDPTSRLRPDNLQA